MSKITYLRVIIQVLLLVISLSAPEFEVDSAFQSQEGTCQLPFETVSLPLDQLGGQEYVRMDGQATGYTGGLYPDGSSRRPPQHEAAGLALADEIRPLDANGSPNPEHGRIVLLSIGMSNTNSEFDAFMRLAGGTSQVNRQVFFLNGALGGATADRWVERSDLPWQELDRQLERYQVSPLQVQAAWIKLTLTGGGDFPDEAVELQTDLEIIVQYLKEKFPNLKIAFLSSRTRSYTYWRGLSPEPAAFETGFAVKWLIEKQISGDPELNFDPARGDVKAPFLSWGPYLWIDGMNPNQDGLQWLPEDLAGDCTHPSASGQEKVAGMLMNFFSSDSLARGWFLEGQEEPVQTRPPVIETPAEQTGEPAQPASTTAAVEDEPTPQSTAAQEEIVGVTQPSSPPSTSRDGNNTPTTFGIIFLVFALFVTGITAGLLYRLRKERK